MMRSGRMGRPHPRAPIRLWRDLAIHFFDAMKSIYGCLQVEIEYVNIEEQAGAYSVFMANIRSL